MHKGIIPLGEKIPVRLAGGKAANFFHLKQLEILFPKGIVITSEMIKNIKHSGAELGENLYSAILDYFKYENNETSLRLAVRSSGLTEDSASTSLAGRYQTILNVPLQHAPLQEAITKVMESYDDQDVGGIIVQKMISPEIAGVCFSVHPITYHPFTMVVEYSAGLADKVVSGEVTPEREYFSKLESPEDENWKKELWHVVHQLENSLGYPVDIEFAVKNSTLYVLQCRPVTVPWTLTGPLQILTRENVGEVIPYGLTKLSASFFLQIANGGFRTIARKLGESNPGAQLFIEYKQIVYFNHYLFKHILFRKRKGFQLFTFLLRLLMFMGSSFFNAFRLKIKPKKISFSSNFRQWEKTIKRVFTIHLSISITAEIINQMIVKFKGHSHSLHVPIRSGYHYLMDLARRENLTQHELRNIIKTQLYYFSNDEFELSEPRWGESNEIADSVASNILLNKPENKEKEQHTFPHLSPSSLSIPERIFSTALALREYCKKYLLKLIYQLRQELLELQKNLPECPIFALGWHSIASGKVDNYEIGDMGVKSGERKENDSVLPVILTDGTHFFEPPLPQYVESDKENYLIHGTSCSPGKITGEVVHVDSLQDFSKITGNKIIVLSALPPAAIPYLNKIGGIITEVGGVLSHSAIAARELGIPYVAGVPSVRSKLKHGLKVEVDGFNGVVRIVEPV